MPPVIALPALSDELEKTIKFPAAPANPPSVADRAAGIRLTHEVQTARRQSYRIFAETKYRLIFFSKKGQANDAELVDVLKYQTALLASDEGMSFNI